MIRHAQAGSEQRDRRVSIGCPDLAGPLVSPQPHDRKPTLQLRRAIAKDALFRLAVRWELFRSDWHIAAAARDTTRLRETLTDEISKVLAGRAELSESRHYIHVAIPDHLTLEQTRRLLDPTGMNISLASGAAGKDRWVQTSTAHLASPWVDKVRAVPPPDRRLIELVECLRNFIAHESVRSREMLVGALGALSDDDSATFGAKPLRTSAAVGLYLYAAVDDLPRIEHFHVRLTRIAERLRV